MMSRHLAYLHSALAIAFWGYPGLTPPPNLSGRLPGPTIVSEAASWLAPIGNELNCVLEHSCKYCCGEELNYEGLSLNRLILD